MAATAGVRKTVSIYDYPEHLNPFREGDNHTKIRFWTLGRRLNRTNSINFSGIKTDLKNSWAFRSFMKKGRKEKDTTQSTKSSTQQNGDSSPIVFRRALQYSSASMAANGINGSRATIGSPERPDRYVYGGSVTPLPRSRFQERLRSPSQFEVSSVRGNSMTPRLARSDVTGSRLSVESTNPFDEEPVPPVRASRRKKKKAPLPPSPLADISITSVESDTKEDITKDSPKKTEKPEDVLPVTNESCNIELRIVEDDDEKEKNLDKIETVTEAKLNTRTDVTVTHPGITVETQPGVIVETKPDVTVVTKADVTVETKTNLAVETRTDEVDTKNTENQINKVSDTKTTTEPAKNHEIEEKTRTDIVSKVEIVDLKTIPEYKPTNIRDADTKQNTTEIEKRSDSEEDILKKVSFPKVDITKYRRNSSLTEDDIKLRHNNLEEYRAISNKRSKSLNNNLNTTYITYDINLNEDMKTKSIENELQYIDEPQKVVCKLYDEIPRKKSIDTSISSTEKEFIEIDKATRELEKEISKLNSALKEDDDDLVVGKRVSVSDIRRKFDNNNHYSSPNPIPKPKRSHHGSSSPINGNY